MELIIGRKGKQPFAITDKSVSSEHLKLTTLPDGNVQVEDLGSSNGTFIDGVRIIKKVVSRNTVIQMGSHYSFKISDVLPEAKSIPSDQSQSTLAPKRVPEYSIAHLKAVWDEYDNSLAEIREKSQKLAKKRMIPMMLGTISGVIAAFGPGKFITIPISVVSFIYLFIVYNEKDTSHEETKSAKERLIKNYTCPNPECHRTLPFKEYAILSQDPCCPYCKCKWTVK